MYGDPRIQITSKVAERLVDLIGTRLAAPVAPLPGEGIADLIFRGASINRLPTTNRIFPQFSRPLSHKSLAMHLHDYAVIADTLGCPAGISDLAPLQYSTATSVRDGKGLFSFFGATLPVKQLIAHRRVAPRSLAASNHSKAIWHINALTFDPSSHEHLLDRCPACSRQLDFRYPGGVSRCFHCGPSLDLRDFPQNIAETDDGEALRFVTGLINPEIARRNFGLHGELQGLNVGEIFMLCVGIAAILDGEGQSRTRPRRFAGIAASPSSLALAGRSVMEWPHGVAGLDEQLVNSKEPRLADFLLHMGIFEDEVIAAVRKATHLPSVSGIERKNGATRLSGNLRTYDLKLHNYAKRSGAIVKMSQHTGIPPGVLFECFLNGSLPCPDNELARAMDIQESSLNGFDDGILGQRTRWPLNLSVRGTVSTLYRGPVNPWPYVFNGIRSDQLPVIRVPSNIWLDSLRVEDFSPWIDFCRELPTAIDAPDYAIGLEDVGFYLDLEKRALIDRLRCYCRIGEVGTMRRLHEFRTAYVTIREVFNLLLINGRSETESQIVRLFTKAKVKCCEQERTLRMRSAVNEFIKREFAIKPSF
ncbi:hypothetical protein HA464_03260 [Rhizobium leguminosarum bv. trifolii]|uniref:hypothetical protein n=1 Tax=Rhizobium ruizarguesonis TaxID=2081791 RepID=UPI0010ECAE62|nr:hypothetical protein [Rhizobium ruizarguesonis]QIO43096.1 hypothetical protein HA464_03260 [Rhizobium leguminosarum bv. trifolii]TAZ19504.1 hypothetical protein ELH77_12360 [Rhizobium ruizarguesonis]